jgi:hypothetical protein
MLAHLKIIWQFHAHPVHQKVSRFFGDDFFLGPNLVSFNGSKIYLSKDGVVISKIVQNRSPGTLKKKFSCFLIMIFFTVNPIIFGEVSAAEKHVIIILVQAPHSDPL